MRIVQLNMWHTGSTGKIMLNVAERARQVGHEVWTFSPHVYQKNSRMETPEIKGHTYFGYRWENKLHYCFDRVLGLNGCCSFFGMLQLIKYLRKIKPDVIHLHNLHKCTFCLPVLFRYIKKEKIKVVWTLHDCWSMTGRCPYFTMVDCAKWKTGCKNCVQTHNYPQSYVDLTNMMWRLKKRWFTSVDDMTIVTPSQWLAEIVQESYLRKYPVVVINNGIDLSIFSPAQEEHWNCRRCEDKKIVLSVAADWGKRKGLDILIKLAERLPEKYQIVIVGTSERLDSLLPDNVISIHRTQDQRELAQIYSSASVFVNPTREENFPTVNIEALASGTPVITFATGGSPEIIDETCGMVVPCDDVDALRDAIIHAIENEAFSTAACIKRASQYDMKDRFEEYVMLYEGLLAR